MRVLLRHAVVDSTWLIPNGTARRFISHMSYHMRMMMSNRKALLSKHAARAARVGGLDRVTIVARTNTWEAKIRIAEWQTRFLTSTSTPAPKLRIWLYGGGWKLAATPRYSREV